MSLEWQRWLKKLVPNQIRGRRWPARRSRNVIRLQVERLEERLTPTLSSYDVYALTIVNEMRANPAAFGQELKQLYSNPNYVAPDGVSGNSQAWQDLRYDINYQEQHTSWRSGFNSSGPNTFLSVISSLPSTRPLVAGPSIDGVDLQAGAENHVNWMYQNGYEAHSLLGNNSLDLSSPIQGLPHVANPAPDYYPGNFSKGENISADYSSNGIGDLEQAVYKDVIGYMLENHNLSPDHPWGHLFNFASYDPTTAPNGLGLSAGPKSNQLSEFNVVGAADSEFTSGSAQWLLSTYRLGLDTSNSYIAGVVYDDTNGTGSYQPGEGVSATIEFDVGIGTLPNGKELWAASVYTLQGNNGYFIEKIPENEWGDPFEVSATYQGHIIFSSNTTNLDAGNRFFSYDFSHVLGLGLADGSNPNTAPKTATDLGTASMTSVIPDTIQAETLMTPSEQDWFSFNLVGQRGANDKIALGFNTTSGQVQSTLYSQDSSGQLHTVSVPVNANDNGESLSLSGLQPGRYYLAVSGVGGDAPDYSVQVQATTVPTLAPIGSQAIPAGSTVTFTASAVASTAGQTLTYSLDPGAPAGAAIDPNTGVFTWTPTAVQAGQTYNFYVRAAENGNPELSSAQKVTIIVLKPQQPPPPPAPPTLEVPSLLAFFDSLLGGIETVNANGTETITDSIFGIPLFVATFNDNGQLTSVDLFGIDVTFLFG